MNRSSGVLLPIFSLPSKYGIGNLGEEAYNFIDFLSKTGQSYWQVLPVNPLSFGNSPYQSPSLFAFNLLLIDFDKLVENGLLYEDDFKNINCGDNVNKVDYDSLNENREKILLLAADRFLDLCEKSDLNRKIVSGKKSDSDLNLSAGSNLNKNDYLSFKEEFAYYLDGYVLYKALKKANAGKAFYEWNDKIKFKDNETLNIFSRDFKILMEKYKILEYFFYTQWRDLKKYANDKGIKIIGDMPIYSGYDSSDCYIDRENFLLGDNLELTEVSGCPPDGYNKDGQKWNNPLYNYDYIRSNNYEYIIRKIKHLSKLYDVIRLDHFRGYELFFSIPANDKTAVNGVWKKGPGIDLFNKVKCEVPNAEFIAEDLGFLDDGVRHMLYESGFPGMKVLQFAFEGTNGQIDMYNPYLIENYNENTVAYLSTHDNNTLAGWVDDNLSYQEKEAYIKYINEKLMANSEKDNQNLGEDASLNIKSIEVLMNSRSNLVIISMQDILGLVSIARINTPGVVSKNNWSYRFDKNYINKDIEEFLLKVTKDSGRNIRN